MRRPRPVIAFALAALAVAAGSAAASPKPHSAPRTVDGPAPGALVGGDTIETALPITELPFVDVGNTCGFADDYDEVCPYPNSVSPDVVYSYTPDVHEMIDVSLCLSEYDTKVYVYENAHTPGAPVACSDDETGCGSSGFQSWIVGLDVEPGNTYYIVVDGYAGDCGDYVIHVYDSYPCVLCPPFTPPEDEPDCIEPWNDVDNGGCDSDPPVFQVIEPSGEPTVLCGTSGTYEVGGDVYQDSDWYQMTLGAENTVTITCEAWFWPVVTVLDGRDGCPPAGVHGTMEPGFCTLGELTLDLPAGTCWIRVRPAEWDHVFCGAPYVLTIDGFVSTSISEGVSWGSLKALYR